MARPKKPESGSRHEKRAPDAFRVAICLSAEEEAISILTAELQGKPLSNAYRQVLESGVQIKKGLG